MIVYRVGILPLINNLKQEIPDVTQPQFNDDAEDLGTFARLETYFDSLTCQGPGWEYYPEPSKRVMIIRPENLEAIKLFGARHRFKVCTGVRYLVGYIGGNESKRYQLRERTLMWQKNINTISETIGNIPRRVMSQWYM